LCLTSGVEIFYTFHMDTSSPIARAASIVGSATELARRLGVTKAAVSQWKRLGVPLAHCLAIERATNGAVTRRDLRPHDYQDIWPDLAETAAEGR
jgi:DNA-binding transcriptional regulator YdaS (Cro superfamily)